MKNTKIMKSMTAVITVIVMMITFFGSSLEAHAAGEIPATGVSFPEKIEIAVGETKTLAVKLEPGNSTCTTDIKWNGNTNGHFSYEKNGCGTYWGEAQSEKVTGVSAGNGRIFNTVSVYDKDKHCIAKYTVNCDVVVKEKTSIKPEGTKPSEGTDKPENNKPSAKKDSNGNVPLEKIAFESDSITLLTGKSKKLNIIFTPDNTTVNRDAVWSSSDQKVATVDANGNVKAVGTGTATIKAQVGKKRAKCTVKVMNYKKVPFKYTVSNQKVTVTCGGHCYSDAHGYVIRLYPADGTSKVLGIEYTEKTASFNDLNPDQEYIITVRDTRRPFRDGGEKDTTATARIKAGKLSGTFYSTKAKVIKLLKNADANRKTKVTFYYPCNKEISYFTRDIWYFDQSNECARVAYVTGKGTAKNKYGERIIINGKTRYKYTIEIDYTYSKAEEARFKKALLKVKRKLTGSNVNKVKQLAEYLSRHCRYSDDGNYNSAYDCLVNGKTACQGYADAAAAVLNLDGVKAESVGGKSYGDGHAWNIVKAGSKWYSCDFCWVSSPKDRTYLMKGTNNRKFRKSHKLSKMYRTKKWKEEHPMAEKDYKF